MLWNASVLRGFEIEATDGQIGTVDDLLFDDQIGTEDTNQLAAKPDRNLYFNGYGEAGLLERNLHRATVDRLQKAKASFVVNGVEDVEDLLREGLILAGEGCS